MGYLDIVYEFRETVRTTGERPKIEVSGSEQSEESERSELNSHSSPNSRSNNILFGPWHPATPEQVVEERRRVLKEGPEMWWWQPRYRLADLERGGLSRAEAVQVVREEVAGRDTVPAPVEDRRQVERTSGTDSE